MRSDRSTLQERSNAMPLKVTYAELMELKWIQGQMFLEGRRMSLGEIARITEIGQHVDNAELSQEQRRALKLSGHIPCPPRSHPEE